MKPSTNLLKRQRIAKFLRPVVGPSYGTHAFVAMAVLYWNNEIAAGGDAALLLVSAAVAGSWVFPLFFDAFVRWLGRPTERPVAKGVRTVVNH